MANAHLIRDLAVGDSLPERSKPPITRTTLALFAGASNDHNPIHIDSDFAKSFGMEDVFAHGMLVMAYLSDALLSWAPQTALRSFETKFASITQLGAEIHCGGKVSDIVEVDGEKRAQLSLYARDQEDDVKLIAQAQVALD